MVDGLPPDSAVIRDGKSWTQQHEIAATAVERSDAWFAVLTQQWGATPKDLPPKLVWLHPDRKAEAEAPKEVSSDPARISAFLGMQ